MFYYTEYDSPIGKLTVARDEKSIVGLWLDGQKHLGDTLPEMPVRQDGGEIFESVKDWLNSYFEGDNPSIDALPLAPIGAFRQAVWRYLLRIPYGEVITY